MKIGFDAKRAFHNTTGLGEYSRNLIRALHQVQPEDELYLYTPKMGNVAQFAHYAQTTPRFTVATAPVPWLGAYWRARGVAEDMARDQLAIYHGLSHDLPYISTQLTCKLVVTIHDLINYRYPENYSWLDRQFYDHKLRHAAKRADVIIAISEQTKRDVMQFLSVAEAKIRVVYQSVATGYGQPVNETTKAALRQQYNLQQPFILNVSSFNERKNQLFLVKSFAQIMDQVPHDLVLVGNGGKWKQLVLAYIQQMQLGQRVRVLDQVSFAELPALYQCADLFVYPSRFEGFGIPIAEAMYARVPVIAARNSSLTEVGGNDCVYFSTDDTGDLTDKILQLLHQKVPLVPMVAANYHHVSQQFNQTKFGTDTALVYRALVGEP